MSDVDLRQACRMGPEHRLPLVPPDPAQLQVVVPAERARACRGALNTGFQKRHCSSVRSLKYGIPSVVLTYRATAATIEWTHQ